MHALDTSKLTRHHGNMLCSAEDRGADLAMDLVTNGLLAEVDRKEVTEKIDKKLCQLYESNPPQPPPSSPISVAN